MLSLFSGLEEAWINVIPFLPQCLWMNSEKQCHLVAQSLQSWFRQRGRNLQLFLKRSGSLLSHECHTCSGTPFPLSDMFQLPPTHGSPFHRGWSLDACLCFLPHCYFRACALTSFPEKSPCFCLGWHLLPLPHMFPVYEEIHVSFQPLCLLKKNISWWYILLLITLLFRNLLATIQMEMFYC